ncbi:MAG: hypothetical protein ACLSHK_09740 [Bacteroides sp.]|uniref:hypothetical protein n=1 Tax=Bacteroides sp. TaxID=29523 RepID=UPI00399585D0
MKIHFNNKEIDILVDTSSYRYTALQNVGTLYLYFASEEFINIPVGAYCIYKNITYYLMDPDDFKKKSSRNFEYTLVMYDIGAILGKYKCRDIVSKRLKFDYTAKPHEHLQLIVDNLNMRDSGWKVGECIEAEEKTINYNHIFCSEALPTIADTFKTEYEIDPAIKTIHLRKVEYNKGEPLPLEYGKDKGFVPGLGRSNKDGNRPVTILYVQGGEQNIDFSKYGSKELLLPKNQRLEYEGRAYVSDADGLYIKRADITLTDVQEDSLDCSNIYPKRVGSVSDIIVSDEEKNFYDFIDSSIPEDLNFEDCLIEGNTMTVIFQSGMLAGKEFEVKYVHKERKFLITPQEIDGQVMPNDIYKPNLEDKYAVFGIQLPDAYICNNSTKEGASWDMFREAAKYLYENEDPKFTFKGELDSIYSKKRWLSIGGKIKLGGYILFKDPQFIPEGIKIRITSIKEYIHRPYSPIIELSNTTTGTTVSSELNKIESNEIKTDNQYKNSIQFTKRRFRDAKETISMLNDALLHFSGSISPISVQTMSLLVGDESLQFRFVNNKTNPAQVEYLVTYDSTKKVLSAPGGILQHMTIGINTLSSEHKASEYKFWDIEKYTSPTLTETVGYYLYVKANKNGTTGSYVLSKNAIKLEGVEGYYHFLVGILNSEFEEDRSFVELFGFTEILPGRITTDRIVSSDGQNFIDFVNNAFRVGDTDSYLDWNTRGDRKLRLKGTIVQSESGDESPIGCFRGTYSSSYTYYWGDEVTYTTSNGTSTYRYVSKTPSRGNVPTNTSYWIIVAEGAKGNKGDKGDDGDPGNNGDYFEYRYAVNGSRSTPPSLSKTSRNPSGWSTTVPTVGTLQYLWFTVAKINGETNSLIQNWSTPVRQTPYDGVDGRNGDTGPTMVYRGVYDSSKVYYGTSRRVDAVKYNGHYYVARVDAGNGFQNHVPTDTAYWNDFGAEFESIATNLLLAEGANIGDWFMSGGKIVSTLLDGNKITLDASMARIFIESSMSGGDYSESQYQGSKITIDANNGLIEARSKSNSRVAYMSPTGIFCNNAETQAVSAILGYTHKASIVGLGFGTVNKSDWNNENFLAGVYGRASNSGTAPAYGGFFQNLMAAGLFLHRKAVEESSSSVYLSETDSLVIGYSRKQQIVYLPSDGVIGRTIFFKQWWTGYMRVYPRSGNVLYDDSSQNDYYDIGEGQGAIFHFTIGYIDGVKKSAWLVSRYKF